MSFRCIQLSLAHTNTDGTIRATTMHTSSTDSSAADVVLGYNPATVKTLSAMRQAMQLLLTQAAGDNALTP